MIWHTFHILYDFEKKQNQNLWKLLLMLKPDIQQTKAERIYMIQYGTSQASQTMSWNKMSWYHCSMEQRHEMYPHTWKNNNF